MKAHRPKRAISIELLALMCGLSLSVSWAAHLPSLAGPVPLPPPSAADANQEALTPEIAEHILKLPQFAEPFGWQWDYFVNGDSARLRYGYCSPKNKPVGTVVILPGFLEFGEDYFELAQDFLRRGYIVYELDWRGMGGSDRYFKSNQKVSSMGVDHDAEDLHQFLSTIVQKHAITPLILVAHSMGSHIALRYLHDHPRSVDAAVLSAPPLSPSVSRLPPWAVSIAAAVQLRLKHNNDYLDGQGDWSVMAPKICRMRSHSHDPVRSKLEYAWATRFPKLQVGGATWQWLAAFEDSREVLVNNFAPKITTPILMGCGSADRISNPYEVKAFASKLPHATLVEVNDGRHSMYSEDDAHRKPWMDAVFKFVGSVKRKSQ